MGLWHSFRWLKPATSPTTTEDYALWYAYFCLLLVALAFQFVSSLGMVWWAAKCCRRRSKCSQVQAVQESVAVVVPCYLPSEACIIKETLRHLLENIQFVDCLEVHLAYNTPKEMALEQELAAMANQSQPGRRLFTHCVPGSTSKAQNLNYIIPKLQSKYVALYDADHHPDPRSLAIAIQYLKDSGLDCVQGSTYIREGWWLFRLLIHAEFFMTYFVILPTMEVVSGTGLFGGSNAVWIGDKMRGLQFDDSILTEDIEFSLRAILQHGVTFGYLPECRSGELVPASFKSLWKQRTRWATGWDQVTLRHAAGFRTAHISARKRWGLFYVFVLRWLSQFCTVLVVLFNSTCAFFMLCHNLEGVPIAQDEPKYIAHVQQLSYVMVLGLIAFVFAQVLVHEPRFELLLGMCLYITVGPIYVLFTTIIEIASVTTIASGQTASWVVTSRDTSTRARGPGLLSSPLLSQAQSSVPWLLLLPFSLVSATVGCVLGAFLGRREVVHMLWGWVPFGIGATTETVLDGRYIVIGFICGLLAGVPLFAGIILLLRSRRTDD